MSEERLLLIFGARSFAPEVADVVSETPGFRVAGFVENLEPERCGQPLEGMPVLWIGDVDRLAETHLALCGLGTTRRDGLIREAQALGFSFATIVHPSARVPPSAAVGEGTFVSVGVIVASHTRIGSHVLLNRGALVGHHVEVGDFVSVQPGANIAGSCRVGEGAFVGMGSVVLDHVAIGEHAVVAAGAVVTKDVPAGTLVAGVPATVVRKGVRGH
jgi:sugar O-acyltransferase (sialic acid O-acetyltransferase NeuD family)